MGEVGDESRGFLHFHDIDVENVIWVEPEVRDVEALRLVLGQVEQVVVTERYPTSHDRKHPSPLV